MTQRQVVRNAAVFDSVSGKLLGNQQIVIEGRRVRAVTSAVARLAGPVLQPPFQAWPSEVA